MAAVTSPRVRRWRDARSAIAAAVLTAAAAFATPGFAQDAWRQAAPWCANMGGGYGFDCSYYTFDQCMATARGLGNFCTPNPRAQRYVQDHRRRRVRVRKHVDDD